jgi:hypothetical protein
MRAEVADHGAHRSRNEHADPVAEVRLGSSLCENSDGQLACRTFISVSTMLESIVLATTFGRRQLRKQFCASLAQTSFHTAWVIFGLRRAPAPTIEKYSKASGEGINATA